MARRRQHAHNKGRRTWKRVAIGIGVGVMLGGVVVGVWFGTRHANVTIAEVTVSGGETVSHEAVRRIVWDTLDGSYFFLVPYRFAYTFPEDAIQQEVGALSRVSGVAVERVSRTEVRVEIQEYAPQALWCAHVRSTQCLLIDARGYAFDVAPPIVGKTMLRFVHEERPPVVGTHIFNSGDIAGTQEFANVLKQRHGMRVTYIERTKAGDLKYFIADGGYILVAGDIAIENTFDSLDAVLSSPDFVHVAPGNFEYIDVRFDGAVYIKDVEEEAPETEVETATTSES